MIFASSSSDVQRRYCSFRSFCPIFLLALWAALRAISRPPSLLHHSKPSSVTIPWFCWNGVGVTEIKAYPLFQRFLLFFFSWHTVVLWCPFQFPGDSSGFRCSVSRSTARMHCLSFFLRWKSCKTLKRFFSTTMRQTLATHLPAFCGTRMCHVTIVENCCCVGHPWWKSRWATQPLWRLPGRVLIWQPSWRWASIENAASWMLSWLLENSSSRYREGRERVGPGRWGESHSGPVPLGVFQLSPPAVHCHEWSHCGCWTFSCLVEECILGKASYDWAHWKITVFDLAVWRGVKLVLGRLSSALPMAVHPSDKYRGSQQNSLWHP